MSSLMATIRYTVVIMFFDWFLEWLTQFWTYLCNLTISENILNKQHEHFTI